MIEEFSPHHPGNHKLRSTLLNNKRSHDLVEEYKKSINSCVDNGASLKKISMNSDDFLSDLRKMNGESMKSFFREKDKRKNLEIIGDAGEQALLRYSL